MTHHPPYKHEYKTVALIIYYLPDLPISMRLVVYQW